MSILRQDCVFKTRLQDLKKNSSLNSNDMVRGVATCTQIRNCVPENNNKK